MKRKGFTLLELLISMTIFTIIIGAVTTVFFNSQRSKQKVDQIIQTQQAARTAIDYMIKDLRAAGYNIDIEEATTSTPQRRIVYASSYEVVFNANIMPAEDSPDSPLEPSAMKVSASERPAHYYPTVKYNTGAETVVFTLDWDNDGLINANDRDLSPAVFTDNPNDYCLIKRVYGEWEDGTNIKTLVEEVDGWTNQEVISIVAGPDRFPSQNTGIPMFGYWIDNDGDPTTLPELYGDTDGDGSLSEAEGIATAPITNYETLDKIELITVNITGVSQSPLRGEYIESSIKTDVSVTRNVSTKVYLVKGHVYFDADTDGVYTGEDGIKDMKVKLSSGEMALTDEDGVWTFAVIPGTYSASVSPQISWRATTPVNFDFTVINNSADFTTDDTLKNYFGMEQTPTASIVGFIFDDLNGDGLWQDSTEGGIAGINISTSNNDVVSRATPPDSLGFYSLTVNAGETLHIWTTTPSTIEDLASSGADTNDFLNLSTSPTSPIPLTPSMVQIFLSEGEIAYTSFGYVKAKATRPSVRILSPNGGELYTSGQDIDIRVFANPNDDGEAIKYIRYYYSTDAGYDWRYIGEQHYPIPVAGSDTFQYTWTIPDTIDGSQMCLIRVDVIDDGNWTVVDYSDSYFTIVPAEGYSNFFFTNEYVDSLKDDSLYLYAFYSAAVGFSGPLPRYLNTVNSRTEGTIGDSLPDSHTHFYSFRPFYTQMSTYAEFVTNKNIPYADSIFPGKWKFYMRGSTTAPDNDTEYKWYDFEVYLCDSFGDSSSRQLLFSTEYDTFSTPIVRSYVSNEDMIDSVIVTVNKKWDVERSDRLYVKCFYSGTFTNSVGGPTEKIKAKININIGGLTGSMMKIPTR